MSDDQLLLQLNKNLKTICEDLGELKGSMEALDKKVDAQCEHIRGIDNEIDCLKATKNKTIGIGIAVTSLLSFIAGVITSGVIG